MTGAHNNALTITFSIITPWRAVVSIVAMQLIRELNRPAPVAAARPKAHLQLCPRHANHEAESRARATTAMAWIRTHIDLDALSMRHKRHHPRQRLRHRITRQSNYAQTCVCKIIGGTRAQRHTYAAITAPRPRLRQRHARAEGTRRVCTHGAAY